MLPLVTLEDVESCFSPKLVQQVFTDDGGRHVGPRFNIACQAGSDEAAGILGKVPGWRDYDSLRRVIEDDASVRYAVCQIVMALGMNAKPEWYGKDGASTTWRTEARKTLNDVAMRNSRSPAESTVAPNNVVFPKAANARQFEFSRRRGRDSSGGF